MLNPTHPTLTPYRPTPAPRPWRQRLRSLCCGLSLLAATAATTLIAPAHAAVVYTNTVQGTRSLVLQTGGTLPLVWAQCSEGLSGANACTGTAATYTFANAATQAATQNNASYLGYTDWRVPNKAELLSLVVSTKNPRIDTAAFPRTMGDFYWTSEGPNLGAGWSIDFGNGSSNTTSRNSGAFVRLVRSGQNLSPGTLILGDAAVSNVTATSATLSATSTFSGHVYWLIVPSGSPAPTASQIVDGTSYGSVAAANVFGGSGKATGSVANTFNITGLTSGQAYQAYMVAVGGELDLSNVSGPLGINDKAPQTLTFGTAPSMTFGGSTGTVSATSASPNSGTAVTYSVPTTTSVCSVDSSSGVVTAVSAGTCTIAANQAGDASYSAATQVTQDITIAKGSQAITGFNATSTALTVGGAPSALTSTVSATGGASGQPVVFTSTTPTVCSVSGSNGSTVTALAAGTCTVAANQAGNGNYNAAAQLAQNLNVKVIGVSGTTATSSGAINASMAGSSNAACGFARTAFVASAAGAPGNPPGITFPHGLFSFQTNNWCWDDNGAVTFTVTYPTVIPANAQYWKFGPTADNHAPHWYTIPYTGGGTKVLTFTIVDGGLGDDDYTANGTIVDDGGPGVPADAAAGAQGVPTLGEWALMLLVALMGWVGMGGLRRVSAHRQPW